MDYREHAIDELSRLRQNYTSVENIKSRIVEMETSLKSAGGGTGGAAPSNGGGNKTEEKWLSLISRIGDEKERLRGITRSIKRIERALSVIGEDEARILKELYVIGRNVDEVANILHTSRATAYRMRDSALIKFTRALYGAVIT